MAFEDLDIEMDDEDEFGVEEEEGLAEEEGSNRMFLIAAGVLGGIALLTIICIAVYALVLLPRSRSAQGQQQATLDAQNTQVAGIINQTSTAAAQAAIEAAYTPTPTNTLPPTATATQLPTSTSVVVLPTASETGPAVVGTIAPDMATATALRITLTANAILYNATLTATAQGGIPDTGFADDAGLPLLMGIAVLLIVVIFLARRLRTA